MIPRMGIVRRCRGGVNKAQTTLGVLPTPCLQTPESSFKYSGTLLKSTLKRIKLKMESLLSLSFDYLSSYDGVKIRKGLRQLEGLLAQICLCRTPSTDRPGSVITNGASKQTTKELSSLKDDPAFREFFKLQEGFEWNSTLANVPLLDLSKC